MSVMEISLGGTNEPENSHEVFYNFIQGTIRSCAAAQFSYDLFSLGSCQKSSTALLQARIIISELVQVSFEFVLFYL